MELIHRLYLDMQHDLRLWLVLIGAGLIASVLFYNHWQLRRTRRQLTPEPVIESNKPANKANEKTSEPETGKATSVRQEPGFHAVDATSDHSRPTRIAPPVEIDEAIHALIVLNTEQPASGERILAALQDVRRAGKQNIIYAAAPLDTGEAVNASWIEIEAGERYETIIAAVQLANRSGPLNEIEYSQCVAALQMASEQIPANCDAPDMIETVARARELDGRCAALDAQIGINLVATSGVWGGELIASLARQQGLSLRADGRFHALNADGINDSISLFSLQNADGNATAGFREDSLGTLTTSRLTLLLDVPRAPHAAQPYTRMRDVALTLAESLQGAIVDDDLRALTPTMLDAIAREIEPVYARLAAEGMPAGSARALALFS